MEGDLTWGGEHTIQCTDDVLWNCIISKITQEPKTCIILLTSVTPINLKTVWKLLSVYSHHARGPKVLSSHASH